MAMADPNGNGRPQWQWQTPMTIAFLVTRGLGLIFGAVIIAAAVLTVLRHREFSHLAPLGLFLALLVLAESAPA